jgi:hypothetical protein
MSAKSRVVPSPELNDGEIAQRAYQRWTARGRPASDGQEDWYAAEAELRAERTKRTPRRPIRTALRRLGL